MNWMAKELLVLFHFLLFPQLLNLDLFFLINFYVLCQFCCNCIYYCSKEKKPLSRNNSNTL